MGTNKVSLSKSKMTVLSDSFKKDLEVIQERNEYEKDLEVIGGRNEFEKYDAENSSMLQEYFRSEGSQEIKPKNERPLKKLYGHTYSSMVRYFLIYIL